MKRHVIGVTGALLMSASTAMAAHVDHRRAPDSGPDPAVTIVAMHAGGSSTLFSLRAAVVGLKPPLQFRWSLGNGNEWEGPEPPPQNYDGGRYDVIVTVTDADGLVRRTSLTIEVEGEHQH